MEKQVAIPYSPILLGQLRHTTWLNHYSLVTEKPYVQKGYPTSTYCTEAPGQETDRDFKPGALSIALLTRDASGKNSVN